MAAVQAVAAEPEALWVEPVAVLAAAVEAEQVVVEQEALVPAAVRALAEVRLLIRHDNMGKAKEGQARVLVLAPARAVQVLQQFVHKLLLLHNAGKAQEKRARGLVLVRGLAPAVAVEPVVGAATAEPGEVVAAAAGSLAALVLALVLARARGLALALARARVLVRVLARTAAVQAAAIQAQAEVQLLQQFVHKLLLLLHNAGKAQEGQLRGRIYKS